MTDVGQGAIEPVMAPLRAVLLDVDGTLLDSNDAHTLAWQQALRRHGHDIAYERLRPLIGKGGDKLLMETVEIVEKTELGQRISDERRSLFSADFLPSLKPTPGARALLERLRADGVQLLVATSAGKGELHSLLRQAGVDDLIPTAATSSDADDSKPDPDIVLAALAKGDLQAEVAIMLGDTPHDIAAAKAAGVQTIALRCGGWWSDASLSGAVAIYDDPADLLLRIDCSPLSRRDR